jgi:peptidoglycan hydrolase-like protein with peptidoglycan-binding domain
MKKVRFMADSKVLLSIGSRGPEVKNLHATLVKIGQKIPKRELEEQRFGPGTRMALLIFQSKNNIPKTGILDDDTRPALELALAKAGGGEGEADQHLVEGQIIIHNKMPAQEHSIIVTI